MLAGKRYLIAPDCDQINSYIGVAGPKDVFLGQVVRRDHLICKPSSNFGQKFWSTLSLRILVLSLLPEGGRYPTIRGSDIIKTQWQLDQNP